MQRINAFSDGAKSKAKESSPSSLPPLSAQLMALFAMAISQKEQEKKESTPETATPIICSTQIMRFPKKNQANIYYIQ